MDTLVIILMSQCPACRRLKPTLPDIERSIRKITPDLNVENIIIDELVRDSKYTEFIKTIPFFPFIVATTKESYSNWKNNGIVDVDYVNAFDCEFDGSKFKPQNKVRGFTAHEIIKWWNDVIETTKEEEPQIPMYTGLIENDAYNLYCK